MKQLSSNEQKAIEVLEKDHLRNVNLINFIKGYPVRTIDIIGDSVMVRGKSYEDWVYISSNDINEFTSLVEGLTREDNHFAIVESWMVPYLLNTRDVVWNLSCTKFYLPSYVELPEIKNNIRPLSPGEGTYIYDNYSYRQYVCPDYIEDRIKNGIALGIYDGNKLVAWIMTHDDGCMGFINVLPEYRRMGYGIDLACALANKIRERGDLVFIHVEDSNMKSLLLARKMGFVEYKEVHWLKTEIKYRQW